MSEINFTAFLALGQFMMFQNDMEGGLHDAVYDSDEEEEMPEWYDEPMMPWTIPEMPGSCPRGVLYLSDILEMLEK